MSQQADSQRGVIVLLVILVIAILGARLFALDRFVTADERKWLARSGNFYYAISSGQLGETFQKEHPGVTIMWAGAAGFLWRYPTYAEEAPGFFGWDDEEIEPFLRAQGYDPLDLLSAGRFFVLFGITAALATAFVFAGRLIGWLPAGVGFLLIAFDPFHVALSRLLHLDGLLSSLMLLSVLAFCSYLYAGRGRLDLVVSALAAGLAWLTKLPGGFLVPFVALIMFLELFRHGLARRQQKTPKRPGAWRDIWRMGSVLVAWGSIGLICFVLLWPAMWVNPIGTLMRIVTETTTHVVVGHENRTFFNGTTFDGDPGWLFYPLTYLWRTTPIVLIGLGMAGLAFLRPAPTPSPGGRFRRVVVVLLLFAACFTLFMSLGAKKFDRYLLPVYPALDLVAGIGWVAAARWMTRQAAWPPSTSSGTKTRLVARFGARGVLIVALLGQLLVTLPTFPYYLSYYNPLLGGSGKAPEVMQIGWGEGLDQAADYLNRKPNIEQMRVISWYYAAMFSYFFEGQAIELRRTPTTKNLFKLFNSDYAVLYLHQWQRELPTRDLLAYFDQLTPEKVIEINGLDYVKIYDIQQAPFPESLGFGWRGFIDWGGVIRLLAYELPKEPIMPGEPFRVTFHLGNRAPIDRNLNVLVRLINAQGQEVLRDEGWPWGSPTSAWEWRDVWPDGHELTAPADTPPGYYRLELSFYDPATFEQLPAQNGQSGEAIGDSLVVDYLLIGEPPKISEQAKQTEADLGTQVQVLGAQIDGQVENTTIRQGDTVEMRLFWQAKSPMTTDYTVFVHLLGPDGQIVLQRDQQPLAGFFPTTYWPPDQLIADDYDLPLPPDAPVGSYQLLVGMYDVTTGQRLPVSREGQVVGDAIEVGGFTVEPHE